MSELDDAARRARERTHVLDGFTLNGHEPIDAVVQCHACSWRRYVNDGDSLSDLTRAALGHVIAQHHDGSPL